MSLVHGNLLLPFEFGLIIGVPSLSKNKCDRAPFMRKLIGGTSRISIINPI
jgi:hypothetical protein